MTIDEIKRLWDYADPVGRKNRFGYYDKKVMSSDWEDLEEIYKKLIIRKININQEG
jgi:hypothetical protein